MHLVIIGNGISGITTARHVRKHSDHRITVISGETDHFFSRTALMYIYMGHMRYQDTKPYEDYFWAKNRIELKRAWVKQILPEQKEIHFDNGETLRYDALVLACGSKPNRFGWPGQDLKGVQGLYSYQDLEGMEAASTGLRRAVIVGGGLIGVEMAEMFHSRHIPVTFLVRENSFWNNILPPEESAMVNREITVNGIDLRLGEELDRILPDEQGRARAVVTKKGETIECQFVGLTVGVRPNIDFLRGAGIETNRGILIDRYFRTNQPDVYAIGDCAEFREPLPDRKPLEQVWYTGRMHGETLAQTLCGTPTPYGPGHWFNSAKFFDIEYQTYGLVPANIPPTHQTLYWEHPDGRKGIRLLWEKATGKIAGLNLMGIRYRHETCDRWLSEGRDIRYVLEHLAEANFDPEFFRTYEPEVVAAYNARYPENPVTLRRKKRFLEWLGL